MFKDQPGYFKWQSVQFNTSPLLFFSCSHSWNSVVVRKTLKPTALDLDMQETSWVFAHSQLPNPVLETVSNPVITYFLYHCGSLLPQKLVSLRRSAHLIVQKVNKNRCVTAYLLLVTFHWGLVIKSATFCYPLKWAVSYLLLYLFVCV